MNQMNRLILLLLTITTHTLCASAQQVVFQNEGNWSAVSLQAIDSIRLAEPPVLDVYLKGRTVSLSADIASFDITIPDTLEIIFEENHVLVHNPRLEVIGVAADGADVTVTATDLHPFVCRVTGSSSDGRLVIDSDTTLTLVLDGLTLSSQKASAVSIPRKQKATVALAEGSVNTLSDAATYQTDSTDTSNGCLYARGSLTITGGGTLGVTGNSRHAISSGKNITVEDGHIIINGAVKDGIHCDKLRMEDGSINLSMNTDASKGIKCKEDFTMTGGCITGEAKGGVVIEDGETFLLLAAEEQRHLPDGGRRDCPAP